MTKRLGSICLSMCLLNSGCSTPAQPQPIPQPTVQKAQCSLVPCQLPARKPLVVNDDWRRALDEAEAALLECATQVVGCLQLQEISPRGSPH